MSGLQVVTSVDEFLSSGASTLTVLTRAAAKDLCKEAAGRGYLIVGMDGGILSDEGTFEPRIEAAWSRSKPVNKFDEVVEINALALSSIEEDPSYINGYAFVIARF